MWDQRPESQPATPGPVLSTARNSTCRPEPWPVPLGHWELSLAAQGLSLIPSSQHGPSGGGQEDRTEAWGRGSTSPSPAPPPLLHLPAPLGCAALELNTLLQASMPNLPNPGSPSHSRPSQRPPRTPRCSPMTQQCPPQDSWTPPGARDSPGLRDLPQDPDTSQYPQDSETPETQRHRPGPRDSPGSRDLWDPETPPTRT